MLRHVLWAVLLSSCSRDLVLPPVPPAPRSPSIISFAPAAAFGGDQLIVSAQNVDKLGNQLVFPGGITVLANHDGGEDVRVDGGLSFTVPDGLDSTGPLVLAATQGRSELSAEPFYPLGTGHPNKGTPVATLHFRHRPVGLVDRAENVLMASSIFDLIVTDGKAYQRVPGRPLALTRSAIVGRGLLSVATPAGRGMMLEVGTADGAEITRSNESDTREHFILPAFDSGTLARTVGLDTHGQTWLSTWRNQGGTLVASRQALPFTELLGAAALDGVVIVMGRAALDPTPAVFRVTPSQVARIWAPATGAACNNLVTVTECEWPDGPAAVVPSVISGGQATLVVSLRSGDLLVLEGQPLTARTIKLVSYAPVDAMAAGVSPGKLAFTKAIDGALFQLDLASEAIDWAVQLRGEPTVIDVEAGLDEIAVGNRLDNAVDIVRASTGDWTGRIAFNLGLGSADGVEGGIVAPYSYDPKVEPQPPALSRMDLLMRNVGLVVSIDASSLEVFDHVVLEASAGPPLRLLVTPGLQTLVVHQHRLGLLEFDPAMQRLERVVTSMDIETPLEVALLPSGDVLLGTRDRVSWYRWTGPSSARVLELGGTLRLPAEVLLQGLAVDGEQAMVVWRSINTGASGGGFYRPADLQAGTQAAALQLGPALSEFVGIVPLREGPAVLFGRDGQGGPVALSSAALRSGGPSVPSVISRARSRGASPDGRYVVWLDEGSPEPIARLGRADLTDSLTGYSSYRLPGAAAGPACDPSGQWLFLPVPLLDQLDVVQ